MVAVGEGVERVKIGHRVTANATLWCGAYPSCSAGWTNICRTIGFHGITGGGGALARFKPLATATHSVALGGVGPGDSALILGAGPIGLMLVQVRVDAGVKIIIVSEPSEARRRAATALGAMDTVDPVRSDVVAFINKINDGHGVTASFDAAAAPLSLETAIAATRARSTVVIDAAWEKPVSVNPTTLLRREAIIRGRLAYPGSDFDAAIAFAAHHKEALETMITRTISLDDVITAGFEPIAFTCHDDIKVMVRPERGD